MRVERRRLQSQGEVLYQGSIWEIFTTFFRFSRSPLDLTCGSSCMQGRKQTMVVRQRSTRDTMKFLWILSRSHWRDLDTAGSGLATEDPRPHLRQGQYSLEREDGEGEQEGAEREDREIDVEPGDQSLVLQAPSPSALQTGELWQVPTDTTLHILHPLLYEDMNY